MVKENTFQNFYKGDGLQEKWFYISILSLSITQNVFGYLNNTLIRNGLLKNCKIKS